MRQSVAPALELNARRLVDHVAVVDVPPRHVALQHHEHHRHQNQDHADRGGHRHVGAHFRRIEREGFRREHVVATAEQPRRAEIGDGMDQREQTTGGQRRKHHRERDLERPLPRRQAQPFGRFFERAVDVAQRPRNHQVHIGVELEREHHQDPAHAIDRRHVDAVVAQEPPHHATGAKQHDPRVRPDERRRDQCQNRQQRDELAATDDKARHAERHDRAEQQRAQQAAEANHQRIDKGLMEARFAEEFQIVGKRRIARLVIKARNEHRADRDEQQHEQQDPGEDHHHGPEIEAGEQAGHGGHPSVLRRWLFASNAIGVSRGTSTETD